MISILRKLNLGSRFVLLGLIGLVLTAVPLGLYTHETFKAIDHTELEELGIPMVKALMNASDAVQTHRGAATAFLTDAGTSAAQRETVAAETQKSIDALQAMIKEGTTPEVMRSALGSAFDEWKALSTAVAGRSIDVKDSRARHNALIEKLLDGVATSVDAYGLSQDPDADNYHLIMSAVVYLPGITDAIGSLRARGADAISSGKLTVDERIAAGGLIEKASFLKKELAASLDMAIAFDPELKQTLGKTRDAVGAGLDDALKLSRGVFIGGENDLSAAEFRSRMTAAVKSQGELRTAALGEIQRMLNDRHETLKRTEYMVGGVILLLLIAGGTLAWLITRSVTGPIGEAVEVARKLAEGDLSQRIAADANDEVGQLMRAMSNTVGQLNRIVSGIKDSTEQINHASKEIAAGNADLSQRTEEQASSLEETASSMEELTSTVKQNAENAKQANQLAAGASDVAVKGGDVVRDVVTTMGGISESSRKIADIIGVIDGIAFQTNILALNAAVEAARAGEQGRGFAVVASEVRSLAQRSANAAKEIKTLIEDSVGKVETGSKLVDAAGQTMEEVVTSIRRVTDIMAEITAASQEQSSGIEQVNQAVTQMDEVTQQNAALVEEAAAAAESMQEQADVLAKAVSVFKLSGGQQAAPHAESSWDGQSERRGSDRATNVARLPATKAARTVKSVPARSAPAKKAVNSDSDWSEF